MGEKYRLRPAHAELVDRKPRCDGCNCIAQWDYVNRWGEWSYGCDYHYHTWRRSVETGPGRAHRLVTASQVLA